MPRRAPAAIVFAMALGMAFAFSPAHAQTNTQGWTLCTAGALNACSSVQIQTHQYVSNSAFLCPIDPGLGYPSCAVTEVMVSARNLQGSIPQDNSWRSAITNIQFDIDPSGSAGIPIEYFTTLGSVGTVSGYTSGALTSDAAGRVILNNGPPQAGPYLEGYITGCDPVVAAFPGTVPGSVYAGGGAERIGQTCDPLGLTGSFTFTVHFDGWFSAAQVTQATVSGIAFQNPGDLASVAFACASGDPSTCMSVVPEPEIVALLGTGLFLLLGFGSVRRRRERPW